MKKILGIIILCFFLGENAYAGSKWGKGDLKLSDFVTNKFIEYIKGKSTKSPYLFAVSHDGLHYQYYYCASGPNNCRGGDEQILAECSRYANGTECSLFARTRTIKWKNQINLGKGKASKIKSKWSDAEIRAKLTELGFLGGSTSSTPKTTTPKITKKVVKKYSESGERSIALSWDGYEDLIAGTVEFDEANYKGNLNLPLPNNDGICDGTYSLQEGGKGTWQITCTNNMGAAGTLKWGKDSGVTGSGRDYNNKKVRFTVSKKS